MQTRKHSAAEAVFNTAIGFAISWFGGLIIYPLIGIQISHAQNTAAVALFTVLSLARSYVLRRYFNGITTKMMEKL